MKSMSLYIILIFLFSSLLRAGDQMSWLHIMRHTQFPFYGLNTPEAQEAFTDKVLEEPIHDLIAEGPSQYGKIVISAIHVGRMYNNRQKILNTKANDIFLSGIPYMIHPATRKIGAGLWCAALGLKINAALYLPHVDEDHIQYRLNEICKMGKAITDVEQLIESLEKIKMQQQQKNARNNGPHDSV